MKNCLAVVLAAFASCCCFADGAPVVADEHGTVQTVDAATPGETVSAIAIPDEGYAFFRWIGDIGAADPAEPTVSFVYSGETVTAVFGRQIVVAQTDGDYANLDDAVAAAQSNDTILVRSGTYRRTSTAVLTVDKAIKIVSESGADTAFVRSSYDLSGDCIKTFCRGLALNHPLAILKGITLFNYGNDGNSTPYCTGLSLQAGLAEYCSISNCRPNHGGCAVELSGAGAELRHSLLARNRNNVTDAQDAHAGILQISAGVATNCVIRENSMSNKGGAGVALTGDAAKLLDSLIHSNSAGGNGGGIYLAKGLVDGCVISNNTGNAAGVYQTGGILRNSTVTGNRNEYGQQYGGVQSTDGTIADCLIFGNESSFPVGRQLAKTAGLLTDTIVADAPTSIPCSELASVSEDVTVQNCQLPCPDIAGAELLNASRFFRTNETCWIEADTLVGRAPLTVALTGHCADAASWRWTFGNGSESEDGPTTSCRYENPGDYTIHLDCGTQTAELKVKALATTAYVSTDGADIYPYDTVEKAARNLQDALDAV